MNGGIVYYYIELLKYHFEEIYLFYPYSELKLMRIEKKVIIMGIGTF